MGHAAAIGRTAPWGTDAEKCRQRGLLRGGRSSGGHTRHRTNCPPGAGAAADVRNHGGGAVGRNTKCTCDTQLLLPSVRKALRTLNRGKICATCMIRGARAAKSAPSWQDIHVVYPPTAICRAFRMHGPHILPKPAHFEYTAAIYCHEGPLFPSEAFLGYTGAKYCHRQTPGNA